MARVLPLRLGLFILLVVWLPAVGGSECTLCTPVIPVPPDRWGDLEPRAILGDTSAYRFQTTPGCLDRFWHDLAVAGDFLVTATGHMVEIWDVRNDPANPGLPADTICHPVLGQWKSSDVDFYSLYVAALASDSDIFAVGHNSNMGVSLIDSSDPYRIVVRYQDEGNLGSGSGERLSVRGMVANEVTTANGTRDLLFVNTQGRSVFVYDLDVARRIATRCHEGTQSQPPVLRCPGVYKGKLTAGGLPLQSSWQIAGAGRYLLTQVGTTYHVWDVAAAPIATLLGVGGPFGSASVMWLNQGRLFYAVATGQKVEIWELPCVSSGSCPGAPVRRETLSTLGGVNSAGFPTPTNRLEHSSSGSRHFLFAGSTSVAGRGTQREYLFDVSAPGAAKELTPKVHPGGYWGWYYRDNPTGFNNVAPYSGVVVNDHVYHSGWSFLDVHALVGTLLFADDFESGTPASWSDSQP